jgi:hypothetical protein
LPCRYENVNAESSFCHITIEIPLVLVSSEHAKGGFEIGSLISRDSMGVFKVVNGKNLGPVGNGV